MGLTPFEIATRLLLSEATATSTGCVCVVQEHGYGATGEAGFGRVGAAGEDDGDARAEDDAGKLRAAQVFKLLGEHVAAFEIGNDENVGLAGDRRNQILDCGGLAR